MPRAKQKDPAGTADSVQRRVHGFGYGEGKPPKRAAAANIGHPTILSAAKLALGSGTLVHTGYQLPEAPRQAAARCSGVSPFVRQSRMNPPVSTAALVV